MLCQKRASSTISPRRRSTRISEALVSREKDLVPEPNKSKRVHACFPCLSLFKRLLAAPHQHHSWPETQTARIRITCRRGQFILPRQLSGQGGIPAVEACSNPAADDTGTCIAHKIQTTGADQAYLKDGSRPSPTWPGARPGTQLVPLPFYTERILTSTYNRPRTSLALPEYDSPLGTAHDSADRLMITGLFLNLHGLCSTTPCVRATF